MIDYVPLQVKKRKGNFFYLPCDTVFFNDFAIHFIKSVKIYANKISVHVHIFDATDQDIEWCNKNKISLTTEITPEMYKTLDDKKGYWVNSRFLRVPEIFHDSANIMAVDPDGMLIADISLEEWSADLSNDWVAMRVKGVGALGGCVAFAGNKLGRYYLKDKILELAKQQGLVWFLDQTALNELVAEEKISTFGMKYVDYHLRPDSKIWTGKGAKKYFREGAKPKKNKFYFKLEELKNK